MLGMAAAVAMATVVGEAMHLADPPSIGCLGALGAGSTLPPSSWRSARSARCCGPAGAHVGPLAVAAGVVTARRRSGSPATRPQAPRPLPAVSPLQVPSLTFFESSGEAVLLALALGPLVAAGLLAWTCSERASTSGAS